jgi:hypothetical protein
MRRRYKLQHCKLECWSMFMAAKNLQNQDTFSAVRAVAKAHVAAQKKHAAKDARA